MERSDNPGLKKKFALFTGASPASRGFELVVLMAAAALAAQIVFAPPATIGLPVTGLPGAGAAILALIVIALAGTYPLSIGHKIFLSLGSGAAFATLLIFPPQLALPIAFAGTLLSQVARRRRGYRLTAATILFNQAQYVATWSLVLDVYARARIDMLAHPALFWLPVVAAGSVYVLVNTWVVTTWTALRKHAWAWDLWVRALREAGAGYAASLFLGAAVARLAALMPILVLPFVVVLALVHWMLSHMSRIHLRQTSAALSALVEIAEHRCPFLVEHSERVAWWSERLARHVGMAEDAIESVAIAGKLHDLGKAALRTDLDQKPGPLTEDEWAVMHQHPVLGADIIRRLPGMEPVARYVRHHHERYDGEGYPDGISGEDIPLGARIIAVAECFDAMCGDRPYRSALSRDGALAQIAAGAGTQFDPPVVNALLALAREDRRGAGVRVPAGAQLAVALAGAHGGASPTGFSGQGFDGTAAGVDVPQMRPRVQFTPREHSVHQSLAVTLVAAQEAERRHIARELHDEIGQALTGLKFVLETTPRLPVQKVPSQLREAQEMISELMTRIHDLSLDLRPAMLDDLGVLPALLWQVERYTKQTGVRVKFEHAGLEQRLNPAVETAAFRIVQEALTNVARYSGAHEVNVRLWTDRGTLHLHIQDQGEGFDLGHTEAAGRVGGLSGMRERALLLGGSLSVESAPGAGTRVLAALPLDTPVEASIAAP